MSLFMSNTTRPFTLLFSSAACASAALDRGRTRSMTGLSCSRPSHPNKRPSSPDSILSVPMMLKLFTMHKPSGSGALSFVTLPMSTSRPPGFRLRRESPKVGAPTFSMTMSTPPPATNPATRLLNPGAASSTQSAPCPRMKSSLRATLPVVPMVKQPSRFAMATAALPTPPEAPDTSTVSPACRSPRTTAPCHTVPKVDITGAASTPVQRFAFGTLTKAEA
mmetsp:Transcript_2850/g.5156  ORF Transcript_2850/g.5156 Transcript_2850/m.5156 type:complete len:221 (-) Transcript_2850:445-1107(-)